MEVEILYRGSTFSHMKAASTKDCHLCMSERVNLFYAFGKKCGNSANLMNNQIELYGNCTCKMWFLWLCAIGNEGAEEATSWPKTVLENND